MANHKQSFEERNETGVNIAEEVAKSFYTSGLYLKEKYYMMRSGLDSLNNDAQIKAILSIPRFIRNIPDFIVMNKDTAIFLEVKGCTDEALFKVKDLESYQYWDKKMPVLMFIYSSTLKYIYRIKLTELIKLIEGGNYPKELIDNTKEMYKIPVQDLTLTGWEEVKEKVQ